jgi:hypothetical protein
VGVPYLFICVASSQSVRFSYSILSISTPCLDATVCAKTVHCVSMICVNEDPLNGIFAGQFEEGSLCHCGQDYPSI